jgi:hypothetical protein
MHLLVNGLNGKPYHPKRVIFVKNKSETLKIESINSDSEYSIQ